MFGQNFNSGRRLKEDDDPSEDVKGYPIQNLCSLNVFAGAFDSALETELGFSAYLTEFNPTSIAISVEFT